MNGNLIAAPDLDTVNQVADDHMLRFVGGTVKHACPGQDLFIILISSFVEASMFCIF